MMKSIGIFILALVLTATGFAQVTKQDSVIHKDNKVLETDTSISEEDYKDLFNDLDIFMDSLLMPRSFLLIAVSATSNYYNFDKPNNPFAAGVKRLTWSPVFSYYHKGGFGITATGLMLQENGTLNLYQGSLTPSLDFVKHRDLATGISYTRFFTKDSLDFYTSPLQNLVSAYFVYRNSWVRPSIVANYGWGSQTDYEQRERLIRQLRLRRLGYVFTNTTASVSDFSLVASVRHDFYFLDVLTKRDHVRLTPQVAFTSGTRKFGFNQTSGLATTSVRSGSNIVLNTSEVYLDKKTAFQPLSVTVYLRTEYSLGKFFLQPQILFDYYLPEEYRRLNTIIAVNAGFIF